MLSAALKREGYEVLLATDARGALALLGAGPVDVLVTDIRMPQMSGIELLDAAKQVDPGLSVIMMTAYGSKDTVLDALRLGATDYVEKGDKLKDELTLRIRKELTRKRLQQENVLLKRTLKSSHQFSSIIGAQRGDGRHLPDDRAHRPDQQHGAHRGGVGHGQGARRPRDPLQLDRARTSRSSRSTAARWPRRCSTRSSSATCAARSPAPTRTRRG